MTGGKICTIEKYRLPTDAIVSSLKIYLPSGNFTNLMVYNSDGGSKSFGTPYNSSWSTNYTTKYDLDTYTFDSYEPLIGFRSDESSISTK